MTTLDEKGLEAAIVAGNRSYNELRCWFDDTIYTAIHAYLAAAPAQSINAEMLEALRGALVVFEFLPYPDGVGPEVTAALDKRREAVRNAIARARAASAEKEAGNG